LFEVGAKEGQDPGDPVARFEKSYPVWPPPDAQPISWYADAGGVMAETSPAEEGGDSWRFDAAAGTVNFFGGRGYELLARIGDTNWRTFPEGDMASYEPPPFEESAVIAGPGYATLYVDSPVDDVTVQVTITEVRPDGVEVYVTSGWLRLG